MIRRRYLLSSIFLTFCLLQSQSVFSQGVLSSGQSWSALNKVQKETLATLEEDWGSLSTEQKTKWVQLANKYEKLPQADRDRLKSRMSDWAKLSINDLHTHLNLVFEQ